MSGSQAHPVKWLAKVTHNQKYFIFISLPKCGTYYAHTHPNALCAFGKKRWIQRENLFEAQSLLSFPSTNDGLSQHTEVFRWRIDFEFCVCVLFAFISVVGIFFAHILTRDNSICFPVIRKFEDIFGRWIFFLSIPFQRKKKSNENGIKVNLKRHAQRFQLIMTDGMKPYSNFDLYLKNIKIANTTRRFSISLSLYRYCLLVILMPICLPKLDLFVLKTRIEFPSLAIALA